VRPADLRAAAALPAGAFAPASPGARPGVASPWSNQDNLARVVLADLFPDLAQLRPLDRAQAMAVPAMARARHIIAGTIARIPLRGYRGDTSPGRAGRTVLDRIDVGPDVAIPPNAVDH
jgi:hypothetical protein